MKTLLASFLLSTLVLTSCGGSLSREEKMEELKSEIQERVEQEIQDRMDELEEEEPEVVTLPSNVISDFSTLKEGDQYGGMTLTDIEYYSFDQSGVPSSFNSELTFEGEITLTADWYHSPEDAPFNMGDLVCVNDVIHAGLIPYNPEDARGITFCFDNQDFAKAQFNSNPNDEGTVTFTIDKYVMKGLEGEVKNDAHLVSVESMN